MDGDTLLTDDRSFPYSDKDLELICGSLVTIRKGTLQVIHLTVKEFLRSSQETSDSTSPSLLVKPEHGSLQLSLVCLRCIAGCAEPLVDLASKAPQIDWTLDPGALERCQARAPLLGYAVFSWLVHLIDCEPDDLLTITRTFLKTFSSPATFSWVETCMASQPDSVLRLLVGISEVRDWLYNSGQGLQLQQEASGQFLASWCIAMSRIFEEYGAVLVRRPWEIYLIGLCDILGDDPNLRKLWQKYGETPLREKELHLTGYRSFRPHQEKTKPHLQLQRNLQIGHSGNGFLVHNEAQNLYIWGEALIERESHCIYVQHDETGQRLPPAKDLSLDPNQFWKLVYVNLSPNGGYLVLFYLKLSDKPGLDFSGDRGLTVAWRINEDISFKRRMNCEPWARVIFSHISNFVPSHNSSRAITFKDEHCCFTPIGTLDLLTATRRPLPDDVTNWLGNRCGFFYSCSGQYLIASEVYDSSQKRDIGARRANISEPSHFVDFCWKDERRRMVDMSPSGRYLVLEVSCSSVKETLYLFDTNSNETLNLPLPEPPAYGDPKFHFSRDEMRLITFLSCRFGLAVMIWDCLVTAPKLTSYAKLDTDSWVKPHQIYVHEAATLAFIVTKTRYIQRIELGDKIEFLDASDSTDDCPHRLSTISRDCSHWALVSYGWKGGKVEIIDLTSLNTPARVFNLQWSQSDILEAIDGGPRFPIGISPDLSILIANAEVFDLTSTTNGKGLSEELTLTLSP